MCDRIIEGLWKVIFKFLKHYILSMILYIFLNNIFLMIVIDIAISDITKCQSIHH